MTRNDKAASVLEAMLTYCPECGHQTTWHESEKVIVSHFDSWSCCEVNCFCHKLFANGNGLIGKHTELEPAEHD